MRELRVVVRHSLERLLLHRAERDDVVVKARDEHVSRFIFHRCQQARQLQRGIRRPISVVSAVQCANRAIHGEVQTQDSAIAEEHQRASALVHRPVSGDQYIGIEKIAVQQQRAFQIWRTSFFFAIEDHL